ncbi:MAG: HAD family phosphatase [Pirellulales bacterium]|nr:HAD family phosphatase [Pirellulales bacterium]
MRYLVLACDYDGTLALHGRVDDATIAALERCRASGRKLLMVTGRRLEELATVFDRFDLFEWIVAENGALLHHPATRKLHPLAERPGDTFAAALTDRGVAPMDVGHVIIATWEPHETVVLATIRDLGLELQVTFNKGAVMVLPPGVNKASGLAAALEELGISRHNVVAVGDAENDHALLDAAEVGVAVANAVPMLKERADLVTVGDHGGGVAELIDRLVASDLSELSAQITRHHLPLGNLVADGQDFFLPAQGVNVLLAGTSGSGKTPIAGAYVEQLTHHGYQFCAIDPEGDLISLPGAVVIGSVQGAPDLEEVAKLWQKPTQSVVLNLAALSHHERPAWFAALAAQIADKRTRAGRPHVLIVYDAHLVLPSTAKLADADWTHRTKGLFLVTDDAKLLGAEVLKELDYVVAVGERANRIMQAVADAAKIKVEGVVAPLAPGEALIWNRGLGQAPFVTRMARAKVERSRHHRLAVDGELPPERSFFFRGPEGKLKLRAANLKSFLELASGIDDDTWTHHLRQADYSTWFRDVLHDEALGEEVAAIEQQSELSPADSRGAIASLIEARYTLPDAKA